MYKFLANNGQRLAFGVGIFIIAIFFITVFAGLSKFSELPKEQQLDTTIFNFGLSAAIFLTVFTALALVGYGVYQIATDFKNSIKGVIGGLALVGLFVITYITASGEATGEIAKAVEKVGGISPSALKIIGGGITTAGIMTVLTFIAFFGAEIRSFFK